MNDTDGEEAKEKEKEKTGKLQGTRNPGESRKGVEGERGGTRPIIGLEKVAN